MIQDDSFIEESIENTCISLDNSTNNEDVSLNLDEEIIPSKFEVKDKNSKLSPRLSNTNEMTQKQALELETSEMFNNTNEKTKSDTKDKDFSKSEDNEAEYMNFITKNITSSNDNNEESCSKADLFDKTTGKNNQNDDIEHINLLSNINTLTNYEGKMHIDSSSSSTNFFQQSKTKLSDKDFSKNVSSHLEDDQNKSSKELKIILDEINDQFLEANKEESSNVVSKVDHSKAINSDNIKIDQPFEYNEASQIVLKYTDESKDANDLKELDSDKDIKQSQIVESSDVPDISENNEINPVTVDSNIIDDSLLNVSNQTKMHSSLKTDTTTSPSNFNFLKIDSNNSIDKIKSDVLDNSKIIEDSELIKTKIEANITDIKENKDGTVNINDDKSSALFIDIKSEKEPKEQELAIDNKTTFDDITQEELIIETSKLNPEKIDDKTNLSEIRLETEKVNENTSKTKINSSNKTTKKINKITAIPGIY